MKFSEKWLREWVNPTCSVEQLCHVLTMAGLEVDSCEQHNTDNIIEIDLTPNRGDCLSIKGIARDVAACTQSAFTPLSIPPAKANSQTPPAVSIALEAPQACPRYLGRVINNININASTPAWLQDRLLSSGLKMINCVVDVMNYVMLELGQPMHAFDLDKIDPLKKNKSIIVRQAKSGEQLLTLDNQTLILDKQHLVIADSEQCLALAGVMGGLESAVSDQTQSVFLESAFFAPLAIVGVARKLGLQTDSAFRFERGVDFDLSLDAIERATQLIVEIAGGDVSAVIAQTSTTHLPTLEPIVLEYNSVIKLLGQAIAPEKITEILTALGCELKSTKKITDNSVWEVMAPSFRFDLKIAEDLIEEICRVIGYDNLPVTLPSFLPNVNEPEVSQLPLMRCKRALVDLGYAEAITYSFVSPAIQALCTPGISSLTLENPMSTDLSVMRASLWPGLIGALQYNQARSQSDIRFFESGLRFRFVNNQLVQEPVLSGIAVGRVNPVHWQQATTGTRVLDFYDIKGHIESVFQLTGSAVEQLEWVPCEASEYGVLHPGQSAKLIYNNKVLGVAGVLHPAVAQALSLEGSVLVFELVVDLFSQSQEPQFVRPSKYPSIGRDISFTVKIEQTTGEIIHFIKNKLDNVLQNVVIFDIYSGKGIDSGRKSVAISLTFQHTERTLVEDEIDVLMHTVISGLKSEFDAQLRE